MRKNYLLALSSIAFIVIVVGSYVIVAQSPITGTWTANTREDKDGKIHISFERRSEKGGRNQMGQSYEYSELQGLSASQTQNGRVSFRLVREAGTIDCEGIQITRLVRSSESDGEHDSQRVAGKGRTRPGAGELTR